MASVNNVISNANAAVQANKTAKRAANQALNAKNNTAANNAARQANTAANNAATAANAARQAQRQVQNNPNVPVNSKNVAKNAAAAANNNARQANVVANIAATAVAPPPPPPPPPRAKSNQNGEPRGDGKYAKKAKELWKDTDRMLDRSKKTNFNPQNNTENNTVIGQKLVDSLHKHVVSLSKSILDIKLEFKEEVSKLLAGHPDLEKTYKQLSNCDVETNNKSGGCPRIRNMDRYITEIKGAIGRKNNARKLLNKATNVNNRQKKQENLNKIKKAQDELIARRKSLTANINGLITSFEKLQKKI